ncbi:M60 family metallopeptidase [Enterobacter asburiae]|uniref:M60 family metallopeptidase n=1 Tax=Enterobacter asburiae TaxID=61645 RepID=UPI001E49A203|nr:M60 family metallopeptidase [Enterobacter asburiae]MCE2004185.1 M60 family metallopeptidase [Enterobacter asburiae]
MSYNIVTTANAESVNTETTAQQQQNENSSLVFSVEQHGDPRQLNILQRKQFYVAPLQPTGLWVKAGTNLVVNYTHSGRSPNKNPEVWVHNITSGKDRDDPSFQKVVLDNGVNNIKVIKTGALYITASNEVDPQCHMSVTIQSGAHHMPTFSLERGEQSAITWRNQVADALKADSSPYAELVGKRMILTAPIADMEKHATNPAAVLKLWDKIIGLADEQYGMVADAPYPHIATRHRYHFFSKPDNSIGLMSSSNEWLAANKAALTMVLNADTLLKDGWGSYHELGHQYEVVAWKTDEEVLENLTSLYVQRALSGKASRLREFTGKIKAYLGRQSGDLDTLKDDSVWLKVAMFWQLDLAFGKDFYARLADRYRMIPTSQLPTSNDAKMGLFIVEASRVAGFNLKPFFNKWGYIRKENTDLSLSALHLKTLKDPIWENTDDKVSYSYELNQQGIAGYVKIQAEAKPGDMVNASVSVSNRASGLTYKWMLPEGSSVADGHDVYGHSLQFKIPVNAIHNSFVPISVTVSDGKQSSIIGARIKVHVVEEAQHSPQDNFEHFLMHKFNKNAIKEWSDTRTGNVGDFYLFDDSFTRRYFRLKTSEYGYFPVDSSSNDYWEYIGECNVDTYLFK